MKKFLLAGVAAFALTGAARAADVVEQAPPAAPAAPVVMTPAFTWSGLYLGGQAGYAWGDLGPESSNGFIGGGHVGYNFEYNPVIFGIEADFDGADLSVPGVDLNYIASARARLGYAFDRFMVYGTGGYAYAHASHGFHDNGYVVGGGIEWAATDHIIPGIEYTHYGFSDFDHTGFDTHADVVQARLSYKF